MYLSQAAVCYNKVPVPLLTWCGRIESREAFYQKLIKALGTLVKTKQYLKKQTCVSQIIILMASCFPVLICGNMIACRNCLTKEMQQNFKLMGMLCYVLT